MKQTFKIKNHVEFNRILGSLTGAVIELESEFYLLPIKDQNQRKMKDGFDDVKNELKINWIMPQKNLKINFLLQKLIWKKPMMNWFQI
jgi:hypothetical protein